MVLEVVFLKRKRFCDIDKRRREKQGNSLNNVCQKHLVNRARCKHLLQTLFRQLDYLLKGLVELNLRELVRVFDHREWFIRPLFVEQGMRSYFI